MIQTQERIIDGHLYQVTQFPGRYGLRLLTRLFTLLGDPAGKVIFGLISRTQAQGVEDTQDIVEPPGDASSKTQARGIAALLNADIQDIAEPLGNAVSSLVLRLDEDKVERIVMDLLESTHRDRKPVKPVFDEVFAGGYFHLLKVLRFVLEVNYSDFFPAGAISALAGSRSTDSIPTSIGSRGA